MAAESTKTITHAAGANAHPVLPYHGGASRRGTACGLASTCIAALALTLPPALWLGAEAMRRAISNLAFPLVHLENWMRDTPFVLTVAVPGAGLLFGAIGLALRCAHRNIVMLAMAVTVAGLLAAVGALWTTSSPAPWGA